MSSLLGQITVILILGVIIFVITRVCGGLGKIPPEMGELGEEFQEVKDRMMETHIMGFWKIEVLDSKGNVVKRKEIGDVGTKGFYIGRGRMCDLRIRSSYVSEKHAVIASDEKGFFLKDCGSRNGVYYKNKKVHQIDLEDRMTLYLGNVACRISRANIMDDFSQNDEGHTRVGGRGTQVKGGKSEIKRD